MESSFGARLREQRERRDIPLARIAEQTKIKLSLLEGLERDDVSYWPAGIFRRSYIRVYAQAIGLDADAALREFLSLYPDPADESQTPAVSPAGGRESTSRWPPSRLRFLIGSAIEAIPARRTQPGQHAGPVAKAADAAEVDRPRVSTPVDPEHDRAGAPPAPVMDREVDRAAEHPQVPIELPALAQLCTRLARAAESRDVEPVLEDAARVLGAVGLVLWLWDPQTRTLRFVIGRGYPEEVVAQLPDVAGDSDSAVAEAFRSGEPCVVDGNDLETGAVVVPLTTPTGCAGVLALELRDGGERRDSVRAFATILAAQLSMLVGYPPLTRAASA